ncbi:hypothetical protein EJ03DRAFT_378882 [Teratosphaeria nubilosa]|uniref:Uncharacterized protein n=1 Tax=Teratosphaeria nubilosa TaxID=161662 RepID=A0A6G1KUW2_9PEZI|nr:hypothetical protein EJ03DRAFT_378882 [Teratosphaeria nubilosa]
MDFRLEMIKLISISSYWLRRKDVRKVNGCTGANISWNKTLTIDHQIPRTVVTISMISARKCACINDGLEMKTYFGLGMNLVHFADNNIKAFIGADNDNAVEFVLRSDPGDVTAKATARITDGTGSLELQHQGLPKNFDLPHVPEYRAAPTTRPNLSKAALASASLHLWNSLMERTTNQQLPQQLVAPPVPQPPQQPQQPPQQAQQQPPIPTVPQPLQQPATPALPQPSQDPPQPATTPIPPYPAEPNDATIAEIQRALAAAEHERAN